MKMFPKMQDNTIDRLLRAQGGATGKAAALCREFDADLANAYVERSLSGSERASYENHLAACSPCRKAIVALMRMAQAEPVAAHGVATVGQSRGASPVRQWFSALTMPQWAMAAAAVIVLAISLPLMLSHRATPGNEPNNEIAAVTEPGPPTAGETTSKPMAAAGAPGEAPTTSNTREASAQAHAAPSEKPATEEKKDAQAQPAAVADGVSGGASTLAQTAEPKPTDSVAAKTDAPAPAGAAPATSAAQPQDSDEAKKQTKEKQEAKDAKASPSSDKRSEQAGNIAPPPPPPSRVAESERGRRDEPAASGPGFSGFMPPEAVTAPRGPSRKVNGHQFWLRSGVWTDKDYKPGKDMPTSQIIRDSVVYHDLLANEEKIKPFLTSFPVDARVIFVFKGRVYFLIPQGADR